jgi:hypothetical protein
MESGSLRDFSAEKKTQDGEVEAAALHVSTALSKAIKDAEDESVIDLLNKSVILLDLGGDDQDEQQKLFVTNVKTKWRASEKKSEPDEKESKNKAAAQQNFAIFISKLAIIKSQVAEGEGGRLTLEENAGFIERYKTKNFITIAQTENALPRILSKLVRVVLALERVVLQEPALNLVPSTSLIKNLVENCICPQIKNVSEQVFSRGDEKNSVVKNLNKNICSDLDAARSQLEEIKNLNPLFFAIDEQLQILTTNFEEYAGAAPDDEKTKLIKDFCRDMADFITKISYHASLLVKNKSAAQANFIHQAADQFKRAWVSSHRLLKTDSHLKRALKATVAILAGVTLLALASTAFYLICLYGFKVSVLAVVMETSKGIELGVGASLGCMGGAALFTSGFFGYHAFRQRGYLNSALAQDIDVVTTQVKQLTRA